MSAIGLISTFPNEIAGVVLVKMLDNQTIQIESFSEKNPTKISEFTDQL